MHDGETKDLGEQLRLIRARRAALADAQSKRNTPTLEQQLADEARGLQDDELIDQFETEVGPQGSHIMVLRSEVGTVIVKRPHRATFQRFQDKGTVKTADLEGLVKPSLLHPKDKALFDSMVDQLPALLGRCANACCTLAGVRTEEINAK